jgi:hypothetical protein
VLDPAKNVRNRSGKLLRLTACEPGVLKVLGEESERKGADELTSHQIDGIIEATRGQKKKRRESTRSSAPAP